jgi:O-antigen ligase
MSFEQASNQETSAINADSEIFSQFDLSKALPNFRDLNFGIVLVSFHILLDMGAIQHIFGEIIIPLKIPFLTPVVTMFYAFYLVASRKAELHSFTSKSFLTLVIFFISYTLLSTINPLLKSSFWKYMLQYYANYIILTTCIRKPSQLLLIVDIFILAVMHTAFRGVRSKGLIWGDTFLGDENEVSVLAVCALTFAFLLFMVYKSKIKRIFYGTAVGLFLGLIAIAASRGGALALFGVSLLCFLLIKRKMRTLFFLALIVAIFVQFAPKKFFNEVDTIQQGTEENTASDRVFSWTIGYKMFQNHPLFGVGPGNFPEYFGPYVGRYKHTIKRPTHHNEFSKRVAHSTPVEWLASTGIVGSAILLILLFSLYLNWRDNRKIGKKYKRINPSDSNWILIEAIGNSAAIAVVGFWIGASFITIYISPFFWFLIPISEVSRRLLVTMYAQTEQEPEITTDL